MNIIGKKYFYFALSLLVIVPGIISLVLFGLNFGIDFTGGSRITLFFPKKVDSQAVNKVKEILTEQRVGIATIQRSDNLIFIRTSPMGQRINDQFINTLSKEFKEVRETELETIGPTIGQETTKNAIKAIIVASILIVLYVTWSFRKIPKPASSLRFGICAIAALIHDFIVMIGAFSLFGHFFNVEVNSLFVTAVLTVIGYSVHDTIVVFDRIRENLIRMIGTPFSQVVNESILQTIGRSLNTSLTVVVVLFAILLFGGESIKWFAVALLIGIIAGTYSSIFFASPLLVVWHEKRRKE